MEESLDSFSHSKNRDVCLNIAVLWHTSDDGGGGIRRESNKARIITKEMLLPSYGCINKFEVKFFQHC